MSDTIIRPNGVQASPFLFLLRIRQLGYGLSSGYCSMISPSFIDLIISSKVSSSLYASSSAWSVIRILSDSILWTIESKVIMKIEDVPKVDPAGELRL